MNKILLLFIFYMFGVGGFAQTADIVVTNTNNQDIYVAGTETIYTITVMNFGPATANNITVQNPIPAGITTFYWEGSNNTFGSNTPLFNVIPKLLAGEFITYTITLDIPTGFTGNLVSTASANAASPQDNFMLTNQVSDTDIPALADVKVITTDNTAVILLVKILFILLLCQMQVQLRQ